LKYNQLIIELEKNQVSPFYLLVGEEHYLMREALDKLISVIVPQAEKSFNLEILDAGEVKANKLKEAMGTLPFLGGRRLAVIRNFQEFKGLGDEAGFESYFGNPDPSIVIVVTASALDKKKKLHTLLYKYAKVVELDKLAKGETRAWISRRMAGLEKTIEDQAVTYLMERVGTDLSSLHNELEKAYAYVGERKRITVEDLAALVGDLHLDSVFGLVDAVGEKNLDTALKTLKNIMAHGSAPLAILGMLARQLRLIWQAQCLVKKNTPRPQIAQMIGVPIFLMDKLISQTKKFSERELASGFEKMKSLDNLWKSSDVSQTLLLENLLFDFCRPRRP
jgi:DNA polymerase-3 subunit delta